MIESQYDFESGSPITRVLEITSSMLDAMRTWQDSALGALPGNSSRTIGVRLPAAEGGINLTMTRDQIADLVERGDRAGERMMKEFIGTDGLEAAGWRTQRWLRYLGAMAGITTWIEDFKTGYMDPPAVPNAPTYAELGANNYCNSATASNPVPQPQWSKPEDARAAASTAEAVNAIPTPDDALNTFSATVPQPTGELQMRPLI